jgi:TolB protein
MKKYMPLLLFALAACKKDGNNNPPPEDQQVLFLTQRNSNNGNWQLYAMNLDGSNQREIINRYIFSVTIVPSHDGDKFAFITYENDYYNLYISDTSGRQPVFLAKGKIYCGTPVWSPDDTKILYTKRDDPATAQLDLYSIDIQGNNETRLTDQGVNYGQCWLSSGKIIFSLSDGWTPVLYTMNADGSNKERLTPPNIAVTDAVPSPNETKLALIANGGDGGQLYVMNTDGTDLKQLTYTKPVPLPDPGFPMELNSHPVWSPDGQKIAYESREQGNADIFVINPNGTGMKQMTNSLTWDGSPIWTKDGQYIVFNSSRDNLTTSDIYIMRRNGTLQTPLNKVPGADAFPVLVKK